MNLISVLVLVLLLASALWSAKRGFLKSLLSTFFLVLLIIGTILLSAPVKKELSASEQVQRFAQARAESFLDGQIDQMAEKGEVPAWISALQLPEETMSLLSIADIGIVTALMRTEMIYGLLSARIAEIILLILSVLTAFLLSLVIIVFLQVLTQLFVKLPAIKTVDRILGFIFGLAKGILLIWLIFALLRFAAPLLSGSILKTIEESVFLQAFYLYNPLYDFLKMK